MHTDNLVPEWMNKIHLQMFKWSHQGQSYSSWNLDGFTRIMSLTGLAPVKNYRCSLNGNFPTNMVPYFGWFFFCPLVCHGMSGVELGASWGNLGEPGRLPDLLELEGLIEFTTLWFSVLLFPGGKVLRCEMMTCDVWSWVRKLMGLWAMQWISSISGCSRFGLKIFQWISLVVGLNTLSANLNLNYSELRRE